MKDFVRRFWWLAIIYIILDWLIGAWLMTQVVPHLWAALMTEISR